MERAVCMGDHGALWDIGTGVTGYTGNSVSRIYCSNAECQWVNRIDRMLVSLKYFAKIRNLASKITKEKEDYLLNI